MFELWIWIGISLCLSNSPRLRDMAKLNLSTLGLLCLLLSIQMAAEPLFKCYPESRDCPDYGIADWDSLTYSCCQSYPGFQFHCQENGSKLIIGCHPVTECQAGTIAVLRKGAYESTETTMKCEVCPYDGHFEPAPTKSIAQRYPWCSHVHQRCEAHDGKVLGKNGNSTHDTTCHCDWQNGFAPLPASKVCKGPHGFTAQDHCLCQLKKCGDGESLNNVFDCVRAPSQVPTSRSTSTVSPSSEPKDKTSGNHWYNIALPGETTQGMDLWYLPVIILILFIVIVIIGIGVTLTVKRIQRQRCGHTT